MKTNLDLQSQLTSLNQLVAVKDDLTDQLEQVNSYLEELNQTKFSMQKELETAGDYLLEQEEKTNKANKTALALLTKLKEADQEIEDLKQYIMDLKSKMHQYVPVKGDQVDQAIADYINEEADKGSVKVMFIRLNPGVY